MNIRGFADKNILILKQPFADCSSSESNIRQLQMHYAAPSVSAEQQGYSVNFALTK